MYPPVCVPLPPHSQNVPFFGLISPTTFHSIIHYNAHQHQSLIKLANNAPKVSSASTFISENSTRYTMSKTITLRPYTYQGIPICPTSLPNLSRPTATFAYPTSCYMSTWRTRELPGFSELRIALHQTFMLPELLHIIPSPFISQHLRRAPMNTRTCVALQTTQ